MTFPSLRVWGLLGQRTCLLPFSLFVNALSIPVVPGLGRSGQGFACEHCLRWAGARQAPGGWGCPPAAAASPR